MKIKKYVMRLTMLLVMQNVCAMKTAEQEPVEITEESYSRVARYLLKYPEIEKKRLFKIEMVSTPYKLFRAEKDERGNYKTQKNEYGEEKCILVDLKQDAQEECMVSVFSRFKSFYKS